VVPVKTFEPSERIERGDRCNRNTCMELEAEFTGNIVWGNDSAMIIYIK